MASSLSESATVKQLGELLQEHQEPFMLDVYLLERGYLKKILNSDGRSGCCSDNSRKKLKKSGSSGLNKGRKRISHCSRILRSILNRLLSINDNRKMPHCEDRAYEHQKINFSEMGGRTHQAKEVERFSSVSRMTVFKSCSESDTGEESPSSQKNHISSTSAETFQALKLCNQRKQKAATDRKHQLVCMEDSKQLSPVSVLELPSDEEQHCPRTRQEETPSASSFILLKKVTEDSIFSASMWELLIQSPIEKQSCVEFAELQDIIGSSSSQYLKTKRGLMQPKHLLSDGIREAVETYGRKGIRRRLLQGCLGPEELGKHICEKICSWGKQYGNATNITQLINSDISVSLQEWSDFQPVIMEIGMEIGNAILEEIRNEIIRDMIDFLQ